MSPFAGTVEESVVLFFNFFRIEPSSPTSSGAIPRPKTAVTPSRYFGKVLQYFNMTFSFSAGRTLRWEPLSRAGLVVSARRSPFLAVRRRRRAPRRTSLQGKLCGQRLLQKPEDCTEFTASCLLDVCGMSSFRQGEVTHIR